MLFQGRIVAEIPLQEALKLALAIVEQFVGADLRSLSIRLISALSTVAMSVVRRYGLLRGE